MKLTDTDKTNINSYSMSSTLIQAALMSPRRTKHVSADILYIDILEFKVKCFLYIYIRIRYFHHQQNEILQNSIYLMLKFHCKIKNNSLRTTSIDMI